MAMVAMENVNTFLESTALLKEPEALRKRAQEDGYLYFKNRLAPGPILELRRQVLKLCRQYGWLDQTATLMEGIAKADAPIYRNDNPNWNAFYCDIQKIRDFHALALNHSMIEIFEVLFGERVLPHSRNIFRLIFPNSARYSTPPHQDIFYIGGSEETWTAWFPLGDCPTELGGLACTRGTRVAGKLDVHAAEGAGGHAVDVDNSADWFTSEFECGDVLVLHSLTIHQGRDNLTENRLRLSCDYRYQPMSHPVREDSLMPHLAGMPVWEDIYADWDEEDPIKYYWKNWNLAITPRTPK